MATCDLERYPARRSFCCSYDQGAWADCASEAGSYYFFHPLISASLSVRHLKNVSGFPRPGHETARTADFRLLEFSSSSMTFSNLIFYRPSSVPWHGLSPSNIPSPRPLVEASAYVLGPSAVLEADGLMMAPRAGRIWGCLLPIVSCMLSGVISCTPSSLVDGLDPSLRSLSAV